MLSLLYSKEHVFVFTVKVCATEKCEKWRDAPNLHKGGVCAVPNLQ